MNDNIGTPEEGRSDQNVPEQTGQTPAEAVAVPGSSATFSGDADYLSDNAHGAKRPARWVVATVVAAVLVVLGAVTVVLVLNHRADVAAAERREAAERKQEAEEKAADEARQAEEEAAAAKLADAESHYGSCLDQLDPLLNSLQTVDARLDVGLNQSDLSDMVGEASVAYNRIDIDELGTGTCLTVGARLENAFNAYAGTVSDWNDCIYDYGCDNDALTPSLQAKWAEASRAIDKAERLLDSLDPNSSSYDETTASDIV
ncbi:hypothetical protein [Nocardioides sp. Soil805]|uniref:hypothetical protein n=1 Tax=Nocardioides sp. Soil805 TaxID=1736416 RepID=UPI000702D098|nr:hypothetical protein [Nocardioides sp. Soil805]KRF34797.1 hypothetical protein ASG94_11555 [Nocardioides sp. Soil805]